MSNYTPTTDFGVKDGLSPGDPDKLIVGAEFDVEFDNIATSSATKLDTAGDGLTSAATTVDLDISGLPAITVADLEATDGGLIDDAGTMKRMAVQDAGVRVVNVAGAQTFALTDGNSYQVLTGAVDQTWTIPDNASVAFPIGSVILLGARDTAKITLDPNSGPILTSVLGSSTSTTQDVSVGGTAVLLKVNTDEWMLSGDIA